MGATAEKSLKTLTLSRFHERTLPRLLVQTARRRPDETFLRFLDPVTPREPRNLSFRAFASGVGRAAALLQRLGVQRGDRVLFFAENSPEWQLLALGAQSLRAEPAALFASLSSEAAIDIALRVRPKIAFVSGPAAWAKLSSGEDDLLRCGLSTVISSAPLPSSSRLGLKVLLAKDALAGDEEEGLRVLEALSREVGEDDPFLLLFTSGTTGRPKGVRLSQRAIVHAIDAGAVATGVGEEDVGLHFLPFAHVAGHDQFALALAQGHELIMVARREDIEPALSLRPTYLFSVPLVYERMKSQVEARIEKLPRPLARLFGAFIEGSARRRVDGSERLLDRLATHFADHFVGRSLRRRLGGRVRGLYAGGAPVPSALFRFYEGLGIPLVELYGMSETAGLISSNLLLGRRHAGSAGFVSPDHEVRVADDGELLLRGPLLMTGHLDPEDNLRAFDEEGFFRTGDLVEVGEAGDLVVKGRKKAVIVLSTGKKVSPEPIEQAVSAMPPFEGALLVGEGRPFLSAVVFVGRVEMARLEREGLDPAAALLPRVRAALAVHSEYEKPKRLHVVAGPPADYPGLLTPTLKLKRDTVLATFSGEIARIYAG